MQHFLCSIASEKYDLNNSSSNIAYDDNIFLLSTRLRFGFGGHVISLHQQQNPQQGEEKNRSNGEISSKISDLEKCDGE